MIYWYQVCKSIQR